MAEPHEPLTERELEIVQLLGTGAGNKEIAQQLHLSPNTVKVHLRNVFTKLDAQSRTEVTVIAARNGWISLGPNSAITQLDDASTVALEQVATSQTLPTQKVESIAPNPQPTPRLNLVRRIGLVSSVVAILILTILTIPSNRDSAAQAIDPMQISLSQSRNGLLARGEVTRWYLRTPLPIARARSTAVSVGKSIYLVGGEVNQTVSGDLLLFNPEKDVWTILDAPKPTPVANSTSASSNNLIYVAGGTTALGKPTRAFELFDPALQQWRLLPALPEAVAGHSMAAYKNQVYIFGGITDKGTAGSSWKYDISAGAWKPITPMPTPRSLASAAVLADRIYIVGGYADGHELATCESYVPIQEQWITCSPLIVPRGGLGLVRVGTSLFAIGGGISGFIGFNERYDSLNDRWTALETPLTNDWQNIAVASTDYEFYVFGGYSNGERLALSYVYEVYTNRAYIPVFGIDSGKATAP